MTEDDIRRWNRLAATVTPLANLPKSKKPASQKPQKRPCIDLHGLTVNEAHLRVMSFLDNAGTEYVMIITGKSGIIRKEFPTWMENHMGVRDIIEIHGGGAFSIRRHGTFRSPKP
jgi:DNA-nicking Smr family endonuclease